MLDGGVVPMLGSGIRGPSPLADQLASPLSEQLATNVSGLAEVAQRVAVTLGERRLYTAIKDLVAAQSQPTDVHRFLAEFPGIVRRLGLPTRHQLIISGNYDLGLERAFEDVNEPFDYAVYVAASGWFVHVPWGENAAEPVATTILEPRKYVGFPIDDDGQLERTVIVKIHGGADGQEGGVAWRNNYVVTEDHYIDYLPTHNIQDHLPIQILDKLTGQPLPVPRLRAAQLELARVPAADLAGKADHRELVGDPAGSRSAREILLERGRPRGAACRRPA